MKSATNSQGNDLEVAESLLREIAATRHLSCEEHMTERTDAQEGRMIPRERGFLDPAKMPAEVFDYVRELHRYWWRVVQAVSPGTSGVLTDHIPCTVELVETAFRSERVALDEAVAISDYLHTLDVLQPLAWHMARGLSEALASRLREAADKCAPMEQFAYSESPAPKWPRLESMPPKEK